MLLRRSLPLVSAACRLHTSPCCWAGGHWRRRQGMDPCGNRYGPLTDTPDWSYADGRPAPVAFKESLRREKSHNMAKQVIEMVEDLKFGKQNFLDKQAQKQGQIQHKLQRKLTAK